MIGNGWFIAVVWGYHVHIVCPLCICY